MEIIVGKTAGFCFGVANAVNKTTEALLKYNNICCLGELVHNKQVINELEEKGLNTVQNISDAHKRVIIRAHGESINTYKKAEKLGIEIIDLTCPKVIKIHKTAEEYSHKGYYIFLIGNSNHPEIIGTISYCGKNVCIIENKEDIKKALQKLYSSNIKKVLVLEQTTFSLEKFNQFANIITKDIEKTRDIQLEIKRTICDATKLRQEETEKISLEVDMMIIVGGKNSSNTNKLYEISKRNCKDSILIENSSQIDIKQIKKHKKIGIMAGASTPKKSIDVVIELLSKVC